jgi:aromatic-L-amino-acid decarboxylase
VAADPDIELAAPVPLNLVCFRHRGGDAVNQQVMDRLNRSGRLYLSHTRLADQLTLRMSIGQANTQLPHVEQAWRLIREAVGTEGERDRC